MRVIGLFNSLTRRLVLGVRKISKSWKAALFATCATIVTPAFAQDNAEILELAGDRIVVYAQDTGEVRGFIDADVFIELLASPDLSQDIKNNLENGVQWAVMTVDGSRGVVGPGFECVKDPSFNGLPQCENGAAIATAVVVEPVPRLGNIAALAEQPQGGKSGAVSFLSRDGSALAGSRTVFVLREVNSGVSVVVPVLGRGAETRADVFIAPGTYDVIAPPPSVTSYGSFTAQNVSANQVTVRTGGSPTSIQFSLTAQYSPVVLSVNEVSSNGVQLSWGRRKDVNLAGATLVLTDGPVAATSPANGTQVTITNPGELFSQVSGLQPGREYTLTLFTTGADGEALPSRSVTVYTARDGTDEAAFALGPNTIAPDDFGALRAQAVTPTSVRVTLPANVMRASSSETPGINDANLAGSGCITGTPFIVDSRVAGNNAFYGVIDVCEAGGTAIVNSDVAMSEVFAFYHLVSKGDEPAPQGEQAAAAVKTGVIGKGGFTASQIKNVSLKAALPASVGVQAVGFAPSSGDLVSTMAPGRGHEGRMEFWDLGAYSPTDAGIGGRFGTGFGSSAALSAVSAMSFKRVSCETSGDVVFSFQPDLTAIRDFDLKLQAGGFRWNITAGVRAGINPKLSFSGQYECALDLPSKSFQLATYPVPVNLELSPQVTATAAAELSIEGPELSLAAGLRTNGEIGAHIDFCRLGWIGPRVPCSADFRLSQDTQPFTEFKRGEMIASLEGTLTFSAGVEANLGIGVKNALVTAKTGFALIAMPLSAELKVSASDKACASAGLGYSIAGDLVAETYLVKWGDTKRLKLFDTGFRAYPGASWEICTPEPVDSDGGTAGSNVPAHAPYLATDTDYQFGYGPFVSGKLTPFDPVQEIEGGKLIERKGPAPYLRMRQLKATQPTAYTDGQKNLYQPGKIVLHPGNADGQAAKVRFTAPSAGNYNVDVRFKLVDQDNEPAIDAALWTFSTVNGRVENLQKTRVEGSNSTGSLGGTYYLDKGHWINIEVDRAGDYTGDSTEVTIAIKKQ